MQEYEANIDKYNSTLEDAGATIAKKPRMLTLAEAVQKEVTFKLLCFKHKINMLYLLKDQVADGLLCLLFIIGEGSGQPLR